MVNLIIHETSQMREISTPLFKIQVQGTTVLNLKVREYMVSAIDPQGGVRGVITPSGEARRVSDRVKNIRFFGEICCSRTIFARVFKVEIFLWY